MEARSELFLLDYLPRGSCCHTEAETAGILSRCEMILYWVKRGLGFSQKYYVLTYRKQLQTTLNPASLNSLNITWVFLDDLRYF